MLPENIFVSIKVQQSRHNMCLHTQYVSTCSYEQVNELEMSKCRR